MLLLLLLSCLLWTIARSEFNLYNTDKTLDIDRLQVNCLHYYFTFDTKSTEKIEYCLDPIDNNNSSTDDFLNIHDRNFTFDESRHLNVITTEPIPWSAAIDLAERYQYYIDQQHDSSASREVFFNCRKFSKRQLRSNMYAGKATFTEIYGITRLSYMVVINSTF
jgi:hypothetical protein